MSSKPGTSTFKSQVCRYESHISLGSGHRGRRRSLSIASGDRAVVSNPNACLSSNSSPSRAEHQYSSNTSIFVSVSCEPAASTSRLPQALHVIRQPCIQLLPIAPGALASSALRAQLRHSCSGTDRRTKRRKSSRTATWDIAATSAGSQWKKPASTICCARDTL